MCVMKSSRMDLHRHYKRNYQLPLLTVLIWLYLVFYRANKIIKPIKLKHIQNISVIFCFLWILDTELIWITQERIAPGCLWNWMAPRPAATVTLGTHRAGETQTTARHPCISSLLTWKSPWSPIARLKRRPSPAMASTAIHTVRTAGTAMRGMVFEAHPPARRPPFPRSVLFR